MVVATKGGFHPGTGSPEALSAQIEESLRRLRTETIDLYYLHRVDPETPLEESLGTIAAYRDRGQIRHVGLSEVGIEQLERGRQVVPIAAVQNRYNLAERTHEEVVDHCAEQGIAFVPFFPLHGTDAPAVAEIAARHGATPEQVALAWLLARSPAMLPIPGTLSLEHLQQNLAALELELSEDELDSLRRRPTGGSASSRATASASPACARDNCAPPQRRPKGATSSRCCRPAEGSRPSTSSQGCSGPGRRSSSRR